MIAQDEKKKAELKRQSEETARLQQLRDGALVMARSIALRHGGNADAVKQDAEYVKCQSAYKDFSSTLTEKEARCHELEEDIKTLDVSVANDKSQLESLLRELERLQQEKHETVADILTAREEKEVSDLLTGISQDRTSQELQDLRDLRQQARAGARVSRELAGVDTSARSRSFCNTPRSRRPTASSKSSSAWTRKRPRRRPPRSSARNRNSSSPRLGRQPSPAQRIAQVSSRRTLAAAVEHVSAD